MSVEYPFTTPVQIRFRDLDTMGHVNNAVYATFLEEARAAYFRDVLGQKLPDVDTVIASMTIDYRRPLELDDEVTVELTIPRMGQSSISMEYVIRANGDVAATAETVQVSYDSEAGTSRPIPKAWRTAIEQFEQE